MRAPAPGAPPAGNGAVDIDVQSGEFVVERIADETLGRQVVALVRLHLVDHPVDAGKALEGGGVELQAGEDGAQAGKAVVGILQGHPAHDAVDLVPAIQQPLPEVGTVLACNSCNQSTFR
jgi:hypothetical protein